MSRRARDSSAISPRPAWPSDGRAASRLSHEKALRQCAGKVRTYRHAQLCGRRSVAIFRAASFHARISRTREVAWHCRLVAWQRSNTRSVSAGHLGNLRERSHTKVVPAATAGRLFAVAAAYPSASRLSRASAACSVAARTEAP
jgi:hypothetical protein